MIVVVLLLKYCGSLRLHSSMPPSNCVSPSPATSSCSYSQNLIPMYVRLREDSANYSLSSLRSRYALTKSVVDSSQVLGRQTILGTVETAVRPGTVYILGNDYLSNLCPYQDYLAYFKLRLNKVHV